MTPRPWFTLEFKPDATRTMTRAEYYAAHRWRRIVQRLAREALPELPMRAVNDLATYGTSMMLYRHRKITCKEVAEMFDLGSP